MPTAKRSPKYPFIPLQKAIDRAKILYSHEGRNLVTVPIAVSHWGYGAKSSGGLQTIAALKNYGLIDDQGAGEQRQVKLTNLALRILLDDRENSHEKELAIKEAALKPKIFKELWDKWSVDGLPSESNMRYFLTFDKDFNENSAGDIVKKFKSTLNYAKIKESDDTPLIFEEKSELQKEVNQINNAGQSYENNPIFTVKQSQGTRQVGASIPVTSTCSMSVLADGVVTQAGISQLIAYLDLIKGSFPADEPNDNVPIKVFDET